MKNVSLALNVLLIAAVGYLYYDHFSSNKTKAGNKTAEILADKDSNCNKAHIAYVELDSMYENITYIKQRRTQMEARQKSIETEWESGMRGLENRKNEFIKRGASITQQEAEQFQTQYLQQQQQIESKKQQAGQALSEESFSFTDNVQKSLREFLNEYNKEKKYMYILTTGTGLDYLVYKDPALNITNDVVNGMNEKMKGKATQ